MGRIWMKDELGSVLMYPIHSVFDLQPVLATFCTGYPTSTLNYPPQPGYPAQQSGYPAQQSGYPAQQLGYHSPAQPAFYDPPPPYPGQPGPPGYETPDQVVKQPAHNPNLLR